MCLTESIFAFLFLSMVLKGLFSNRKWSKCKVLLRELCVNNWVCMYVWEPYIAPKTALFRTQTSSILFAKKALNPAISDRIIPERVSFKQIAKQALWYRANKSSIFKLFAQKAQKPATSNEPTNERVCFHQRAKRTLYRTKRALYCLPKQSKIPLVRTSKQPHEKLLGIQRISNPSTENQRHRPRLTQIVENQKVI